MQHVFINLGKLRAMAPHLRILCRRKFVCVCVYGPTKNNKLPFSFFSAFYETVKNKTESDTPKSSSRKQCFP